MKDTAKNYLKWTLSILAVLTAPVWFIPALVIFLIVGIVIGFREDVVDRIWK